MGILIKIEYECCVVLLFLKKNEQKYPLFKERPNNKLK